VNLVPPFSSRPYTATDLHAVVRFAQACTAVRLPGLTYWNAGDVPWQLGVFPAATDFARLVRLWEATPGEVVALAIFEPPLNFEFDVLPGLAGRSGIEDEILAWAESLRRQSLGAEGEIPKAYEMLGMDTLSTTCLDSDAPRIAFLEAHAYTAVERHAVRYARRLAEAISSPAMPAGMRVRHATDSDIEARAELHRDAWSVWGPSAFSAGRYRRLRQAPIYDEELDIVLEDADGRLLSYCIAWFDASNGIGHFEPVGTRPAFAGQGLARAVVTEGLRRLRALGAHTALIGTASVNAPALRTYAACGFELVDRQRYWSRSIS